MRITPAELDAAARIAWAASFLIAAALTIPVFLVHRVLVKRTGMRAVSLLVAAVLLVPVYASAAMALMWLVNFALDDRTQVGSTFTLGIVYYHPGLLTKLSLLAAIALTWSVLAWRFARGERIGVAVT